jgi:glycosyltransferase involved in cell wall biosynthesis
MRILVCNWRDLRHPGRGGAEVYTHEVLRRWAARGHQITWFSSAVPGAPARERDEGIEYVRAGGRFTVYREAARWYRDEGHRNRYDLVIDEVNTRPFACHRWVGDVPVVALAHQVAKEVWFAELPLPAAALGRYLLEPRWLRELRHVPTLTISASSRGSLLEAGVQRVVVVPAGAEATPGADLAKEDRPTAMFIGRLTANKRPDHAAAAVALARRRLPDLRLWMVGDGPLRGALDGYEGLTLWGRVTERRKQELLGRAHVLVITSVREGWGLVVDEAAHAGTPTIGYDTAGLRDSIAAAGGRLVEPRPEALAEALVQELTPLTDGTACPLPRRGGGAVSWDTVADAVMAAITGILDLDDRASEVTPWAA